MATRERGILCSAPMTRALLEERKTQTRRIMKPDSPHPIHAVLPMDGMPGFFDVQHVDPRGGFFAYGLKCPYGQPGDRLWVRETWRVGNYGTRTSCDPASITISYRAGGQATFLEADLPAEKRGPVAAAHKYGFQSGRWRPSIHMPRWASRYLLEITNVRVQRVNDISEADCYAEGVQRLAGCGAHFVEGMNIPGPTARSVFANLWDSINGKTHPWDSGPWVWALTFKRIEAK